MFRRSEPFVEIAVIVQSSLQARPNGTEILTAEVEPQGADLVPDDQIPFGRPCLPAKRPDLALELSEDVVESQ